MAHTQINHDWRKIASAPMLMPVLLCGPELLKGGASIVGIGINMMATGWWTHAIDARYKTCSIKPLYWQPLPDAPEPAP